MIISSSLSIVNLFQPVVKDNKGKHIRRTNSLETLSSSYINGQWPRENGSTNVNVGSGICKSTQVETTFSCFFIYVFRYLSSKKLFCKKLIYKKYFQDWTFRTAIILKYVVELWPVWRSKRVAGEYFNWFWLYMESIALW